MAATRVADILPLTPFQEGLIFDAGCDQACHVQFCFDLEGELDAAALRAAADTLVRRHTALRAAFRPRRTGELVQLVVGGVRAAWIELDVRLPSAELERLTSRERDQRFDLAQPQSVRFTLIRYATRRARFLVTHHHLLLDSRSVPLLLSELFLLYERRGDDSGLPDPIPHRDYLSWLARQDTGQARDAWRRALSGVTGPTLLAPADAVPLPPDRHTVPIPPGLITAIETMTQRYGLTFSTIVQGAWAIMLARMTGRDDVCFGAAVPGRPADLPGAEAMIGSSVNVVPVRVELPAAQPVVKVLARLQDRQAEMIPHQHLGLAQIRQATGLPQLFDTLVTVGNPLEASALRGLRTLGVQVHDASHVPVRVTARRGPDPLLDLDDRVGLPGSGAVLAGQLVRLLGDMVADPESAVGRLWAPAPSWSAPSWSAPTRSSPSRSAPSRSGPSPRGGEPWPVADMLARLLPIRTGGGQPPLFCLPGQDGLSWQYHRLTGHLRADVPIYGLQACALARPGELPGSLDELADGYLAQIREVRPDGPYCLLGWSAGGNIAHAIATRLQSQGAEVPVLAILDSHVPSRYRADAADDEEQFLARIAEVLGHGGEPCDRRRALTLLRAAYPGMPADEGTLATFIDSAVNTKAVIRNSVPGVFRGDVLFFTAAGPPGIPAPPQAWQEYVAGRIETHRVGWAHHDMLKEEALAEIGPVLSRWFSARPAEVPA
jgi:thioesterase domain-containing protein